MCLQGNLHFLITIGFITRRVNEFNREPLHSFMMTLMPRVVYNEANCNNTLRGHRALKRQDYNLIKFTAAPLRHEFNAPPAFVIPAERSFRLTEKIDIADCE